jgi:hypothetical protein
LRRCSRSTCGFSTAKRWLALTVAHRKIVQMEEAAPVSKEDIPTLANEFGLELQRLNLDPEFGLPRRVVSLQRRLARRSERQLQEILMGAAIALAVTLDGTTTPRRVLEQAMDAAKFPSWDEEVKPKIKRIRHAMGGDDAERKAAEAG